MTKQRYIINVLLVLVAIASGTAGTASTARAQAWDTSHYSAQAAGPTSTFDTQGWDDRSDELPGLVSGKSLLAIAVVGAGVITTALVLRARKNKKKKEEETRNKVARADSSASLSAVYGDRPGHAVDAKNLQERLLEAQRQVPVNLMLGLRRDGPVGADKALFMGVSVTF